MDWNLKKKRCSKIQTNSHAFTAHALNSKHTKLCVCVSSSWPFSLTDSIQPVALRVTRPLLSLVKSFKSKFPKWITEVLLKYLAKYEYQNLLITSRILLNILSSSLVSVHVQSNVSCFTIFHNNLPFFPFVCPQNAPESSWLMELFWTFFAPCTVYHVR